MQCVRLMNIRNEKTGMWNKVPCGNCYACLANRRNQWTFRMMNELEDSESAYFVTLTYDEENVPRVKAWDRWMLNTLDKEDLQKFNKKLRQFILANSDVRRWMKETKTGYSPKYRYFGVGEYGTKGDRPHYHVIMYNLPQDFVWTNPINGKMYSEDLEYVWQKGLVDVEPVNKKLAHYCAKYTLESYIYNWFDNDFRQKPFAMMSRNPGIGNNYLTDETKNYFHSNKNCFTYLPDNYKQSLGRYYKDKIFPEQGLSPDLPRNVMQRKAIENSRAEDKRERELCAIDGKDITEFRKERYREAVKKIKRNLKKNKL